MMSYVINSRSMITLNGLLEVHFTGAAGGLTSGQHY